MYKDICYHVIYIKYNLITLGFENLVNWRDRILYKHYNNYGNQLKIL